MTDGPRRPTPPPRPAGAPLSVWASAQRAPRTQRAGRYVPATITHPARMLPDLAAHAITTYTRPGEMILDPMCGAGTTLVEAVHAGRDAIGVDCVPAWVELATANLTHAQAYGATGHGQVTAGDARQLDHLLPARLHGRVALVLTSPPYGPSVHGQVTPTPGAVIKTHDRYNPGPRDRANLAHQPLDHLTTGFAQILTACLPFLAPDGRIVVTARPWRRNGHLVDLPAVVLDAAHTAGLHCVERCVALLAALRDSHLIARPSFFQLLSIRQARTRGIPLHLITHEDVLVLARRPTDPSHRTAPSLAEPTELPRNGTTDRRPASSSSQRSRRKGGSG